MPDRLASLLMLLVLFCPALLRAEQGFYQEVDPDGHVRTVKIPQKPGIESVKTDAAFSNAKAPDVPEAAPATEMKSSEKFAPYNGDNYLDSERLEASGFNPEKKSRFYIVNNGVASRVEQNLEEDATTREEQRPQFENIIKGSDLPSEREEITDTALIKALLASESLCISSEALKNAKSLVKRRSEALVIDKKTLQYREPLGVVGAYKFAADGVKMLALRSYARNDRTPAFVSPIVAMADTKGCINRVVTGYFQTRYQPTKATHSMLQGAVTINASEPYLLLIAPEKNQAGTSYSRSLYGQLSIKWQP